MKPRPYGFRDELHQIFKDKNIYPSQILPTCKDTTILNLVYELDITRYYSDIKK